MRQYKCLARQEFSENNFRLIPVRDKDKYQIMKWRNEQLYVLRQKHPLTEKQQDWYFENVVDKLFMEDHPHQLLWSFLENEDLVGYGGLVHIDWESKNAEISFLNSTERSVNEQDFINDWKSYLAILKQIAGSNLRFTKIFTYSYDIRPMLYMILNESRFVQEARLKNHVKIEGSFHDVVIHSFFFEDLSFRMASKDDAKLYFDWVNDEDVRKNSYKTDLLEFNDHCEWFTAKLNSGDCYFYLFHNRENKPVGQVRIDKLLDETVIGISVDKEFRGKSLSTRMLIQAIEDYHSKFPEATIIAYIKCENNASYKAFIKAGFLESEIINNKGAKSFKLFKKGNIYDSD